MHKILIFNILVIFGVGLFWANYTDSECIIDYSFIPELETKLHKN